MKQINLKSWILVIILLVIGFSLPTWAELFTVQLTTIGLYLGILAMSFIFLAGFGDMISLAQMSYATMTGYIVAIGVMRYELPYATVIPLAIIGGVLLSAVFGIIAIRVHKIYFFMMTLALSQLFYGVGMQWASMTGGIDGYTGIPRPEIFGISLTGAVPMYFITLVSAITCYVFLKRLIQSPFGIALQGIRDNPRRMAALGFNVQLHRYIAIVISGLIASIAGLLVVFFTGVVVPDRAHLPASIQVVMASLVGGVSNLSGGILGGLLMAYLISATGSITIRYWTIIGTLFILIVVFLPDGLLGTNSQLKNWISGIYKKIQLQKSRQ